MTEGIEALAAWPPAAVATVVAALSAGALTLLGAVVGGCWAVLRWRRGVHREERDRAWTRIVWAVDLLCADDVGRNEIGRDAFRAVYDMQIARDEDVEFVSIVSEITGFEKGDATWASQWTSGTRTGRNNGGRRSESGIGSAHGRSRRSSPSRNGSN
jgi:hypothetical protein